MTVQQIRKRQRDDMNRKQKMLAITRRYSWIVSAALSFFGLYGVTHHALRLNEDILVLSNSVVALGAFVLLIPMIRYAVMNADKRVFGYAAFGGLVFSAMLVTGAKVFVSDHVPVTSFSMWIGILFIAILFWAALVCLFQKIPSISARVSSITWKHDFFKGGAKYFFLVWAFVFACWLPALLAGYPGIFSYDSIFQLNQYMTGALQNNHPVLHTLYLGVCVQLGVQLFGSYSTGMLFYSVTQMLAMSAVFAYVYRYMARRSAPALVQLTAIAFFALVPIQAMFAVSSTKDVLFSALFLLLVLFLLDMVRDPDSFFGSKKQMLRLGVTAFFMMALRHNGIYVLIILLPFLVIGLRKHWKKVLCIFLGCMVLYSVYSGPFLNLVIQSTPGDMREALSVPMQQLARTVVLKGDELTDQELSQIYEIIPQEGVAGYNPRISDQVKLHFQTDVFKQDPGKYLKLWLKLGLRFPGVYVDSFVANNFGYWYPDMAYPDPLAWHPYLEFRESHEFRDFQNIYVETKAPLLKRAYQGIAYGTFHQRIPVISSFMNPAFSVWMMFLCMLFLLYLKKYKQLLPLMALFLLWGTLLLAPVVLLRYAYPIVLCLPVFLFIVSTITDWSIPPKTVKRK